VAVEGLQVALLRNRDPEVEGWTPVVIANHGEALFAGVFQYVTRFG